MKISGIGWAIRFTTACLVILLVLGLWFAAHPAGQAAAAPENQQYLPLVVYKNASGGYLVLGWNDLGMHCYDRDYSALGVLPPYNTLVAQVIRRGNPPQIVTAGITVEYGFPHNTDSVSKTNFWNYAEKLFGMALAPNVGLAGKSLSGHMDLAGDHFTAVGIPVTEYSDGALNTPDYFQLAHLVVRDAGGTILAQSDVVAPVSSEMRCDTCHVSPSPTNFRMNILHRHDAESGTNLEAQAAGGNPVLCAGCHSDPALSLPGQPGLPSLSAAMHSTHAEETSNCYACHPGPNTRCLRDVMSTQFGLTCTDCHVGGMQALGSEGRTPWMDEPRCANCHAAAYAENQATLYRFSKGHGGLFCESCHNSTHAILTSRVAQDNLQSIALQGHAGTIGDCLVCHLTQPGAGGPHHE